jgi:hypothetical protein
VYRFGFSGIAFLPGIVISILALVVGGIWNADGDRFGFGQRGDDS